jgi:hypothetical protein
MNQSTIYRRHEARLSKTYVLRDDPRPAFLRVLSGLPLFRIIVPPYNNQSSLSSSSSSSSSLPTVENKQQEQQQAQQNNGCPKITGTLSIGDYSEETLFTPSDIATTTAINYISSNNDGTTLTSERVMQAMLATGVCSGFAEYMFGIKSTTSLSSSLNSSSPFRKQQHITGQPPPPLTKTLTTNVHFPLFFRPEATASSSSSSNVVTAFGVYANKHSGSGSSSSSAHEKILINNTSNANINNNSNTTSVSSTRTTTTTAIPFTRPIAGVITTALSTSVLFGTKIFLDATIMENNNQRNDQYGSMDYYSRRPTTVTATTTGANVSSFLSSAIAGGVVGISRLAFLEVQRRRQQKQQVNHLQSQQQQQYQQQLNSNYSVRFMGRNVLAAILYFSIYEGASSFSSSSLSRTSPMDDSYDDINNKNINTKKGTMSILTGGALAGIAQVFTMNYHHHRYNHHYYHSTYTPPTIWWTRIMTPATVRAVPIHAMIFYGYEQMNEGVACC